jgi:hypothetical protein
MKDALSPTQIDHDVLNMGKTQELQSPELLAKAQTNKDPSGTAYYNAVGKYK